MNERELLIFFPNASPSTVARNCPKGSRVPSNAKPQPSLQHELVRKVRGTEKNARKVLVRITSFRMRLLDDDDQCDKYFIDCLRYSGLIYSDAKKETSLPRPWQTKVESKEEERVEIEIHYLE